MLMYNPVDWCPWGEEAFEKTRRAEAYLLYGLWKKSLAKWMKLMLLKTENISWISVALGRYDQLICRNLTAVFGSNTSAEWEAIQKPDWIKLYPLFRDLLKIFPL